MNKIRLTLLTVLVLGLNTSCFEDMDDNAIATVAINDFVWKAMNAVYLYKAEIPDLANDRFLSNEDYNSYLNSFSTPEELFESVIYNRDVVDRFSRIRSNYYELEQQLNGVFTTNGLEINLYYVPNSNTNIFGAIRLVLNDSPASNLGLQRGQFFNAVNGTTLTVDNYENLLTQDSYTLHFATYNDNGTPDDTSDDSINSTSDTASLTKVAYTENPVYMTKIIEVDGQNVGYLMYNSFNSNYHTQLNNAFATFQANNVQHLVLDLRYNGGGTISTAVFLGSMITGQFNGQIFSKTIYNEDLQELNTNYNFTNSLGSGGSSINSLFLNKVYVLTTGNSASASELVINSLKEYIDVVQVGDFTTGKTQASRIVYDSPNLGPNNKNPNHTYALLPLIANSINVNDEEVPANGLAPQITVVEQGRNLGTLGEVTEPLLAAALANIQGGGRFAQPVDEKSKPIKNNIDKTIIDGLMFITDDDIQ